MKTLSNKFWFVLVVAVALFAGCEEYDDLVTNTALEGGLVEPQKASINYLIGDPAASYNVVLLVPQGEVVTQEIELWARFSDALGTGELSYVKSVAVSHTVNSDFVTIPVSYNELQATTKRADGSNLPTDDLQLSIGDNWTLVFRSRTTGGDFINAATTQFGVATRFAGTYAVGEKHYWRIGEHRTDLDQFWPPSMDIISIDASTYKLLEWAGLFAGNQLFFTIDGNLDIYYPKEYPAGTPQTLNGQLITNCVEDPGDLTNVFCDDPLTNTAERVDPSQEDILRMAFGYFTPGSGPREFYQHLTKIVD